jgi:hypothetical protein
VSAAGFVEDAPDHILAKGGTRPREGQQHLRKMHLAEITYLLRNVRVLALGLVKDAPDHILAEGGTRRPQKHQQGDWRKTHWITYMLRWNEATRLSAAGFVKDTQDHIHAKSGTKPQKVSNRINKKCTKSCTS